jgi:hypothetical protein
VRDEKYPSLAKIVLNTEGPTGVTGVTELEAEERN